MVLEDSPHLSPRTGKTFWYRLRQRRWGEPLVYAFIFLAGLVFFAIQLCTWAIPQLTLMQEFIPTRGVVRQTRIVEKTLDSRNAYRPEVLIEYKVRENLYRTWTFDFRTLDPKDGFSTDRDAVRSALDVFPVGRKIECRYHPDRPEQAIVVWRVSIWGWFFLVLSFSLMILGLVGFSQSFHFVARSVERRIAVTTGRTRSSLQSLIVAGRSTDWPGVPDIRLINESPGTHLTFRLPLGSRPLFPLVGLTLFAVAWIAVACGITFHSLVNPAVDWYDWVIGIILRALFWGVGIVLLVWVFHQLLLAFGMGPTLLEISDHPIYPGRRYRLLLHQAGVLRFRRLSLDLLCEEIARFHQGTDTITNRKEVFRQTLFEQFDFETTPNAPLNREFFLQLPIGAMHSFRHENNEVVWKMEIVAQIVGWPDVRRECPVIIRPATWSDHFQEGIGL